MSCYVRLIPLTNVMLCQVLFRFKDCFIHFLWLFLTIYPFPVSPYFRFLSLPLSNPPSIFSYFCFLSFALSFSPYFCFRSLFLSFSPTLSSSLFLYLFLSPSLFLSLFLSFFSLYPYHPLKGISLFNALFLSFLLSLSFFLFCLVYPLYLYLSPSLLILCPQCLLLYFFIRASRFHGDRHRHLMTSYSLSAYPCRHSCSDIGCAAKREMFDQSSSRWPLSKLRPPFCDWSQSLYQQNP